MQSRATWIREQIEAIERQVRGRVETLLVPDFGRAPHRDQPEMVLEMMRAFVMTCSSGWPGPFTSP